MNLESNMGIITVLVFSIGLATTYGTKCGDVSGTWKNELGSRMILNVDDSNRIHGNYFTAVESTPGDAAIVSNITGLFSKQKDGSLLAFSVLFNHGLSLTSWVGQCMVCDNKEVLYTTYNLRRYAPNFNDKWRSMLVHQNTFWRDEEQNAIDSMRLSPEKAGLSLATQKLPGGLEVNGKWKSSDKEEIEIFVQSDDVLKGKYQTLDLIGRKDGNDSFTAVGIMHTSHKKIKSWTGYVYSSTSYPHTLELSWLEHEFNPSCQNPRKMVTIGLQNFTRPISRIENMNKPETFMDKIRKFFSSMF